MGRGLQKKTTVRKGKAPPAPRLPPPTAVASRPVQAAALSTSTPTSKTISATTSPAPSSTSASSPFVTTLPSAPEERRPGAALTNVSSITSRRHTTRASESAPGDECGEGDSPARALASKALLATGSASMSAPTLAHVSPTTATEASAASPLLAKTIPSILHCTTHTAANGPASRRIVVPRPRKTSNDSSAQTPAFASASLPPSTAPAATATPTSGLTVEVGPSVTLIQEVPYTPRGWSRTGFTVAGDMSAARASLDRTLQRTSQGHNHRESTQSQTSSAVPPALAGGVSRPSIAHCSSDNHEHTPAGSGARAAQYQQQNSMLSDLLSPPACASRSLSAPSLRSGRHPNRNNTQSAVSGGGGGGGVASSSTASSLLSSSSSEYNSSFSEEQEECDIDEDERTISPSPSTSPRVSGTSARTRDAASAGMATTSTPTTASPRTQPTQKVVVASSSSTPRTSAAAEPSSSSAVSASGRLTHEAHPRAAPITTAATASSVPSRANARGTAPSLQHYAVLPQLSNHATANSGDGRLREDKLGPPQPRAAPTRSAEVTTTSREHPEGVPGENSDDDDDDDDDFNKDDFDEEDEEQAVLSYMGTGAREMRASLQLLSSADSQRHSTASLTPTVSDRLHDTRAPPTAPHTATDMTVLSTNSSPTVRPRQRVVEERSALPSPYDVVSPRASVPASMSGRAGSLTGSSPRGRSPSSASDTTHPRALPSSSQPPQPHVSEAKALKSDPSARVAGTSTAATTLSARHAQAGVKGDVKTAAAGRAAPATTVAASCPEAPGTEAPTASPCVGLSLHDAFYLDTQKQQWLVDDLVLAKVLAYVGLMGYEHPLAPKTPPAAPTPGAWPGSPRATADASRAGSPASGAATSSSSPSPSRFAEAADPLLWSSTAAVPSPLVFAATPQERIACPDGIHRRAALRTSVRTAAQALEASHRLPALLFLDQVEPLRWISEQEYVIGTVLLACAYAAPPTSTPASPHTTTSASHGRGDSVGERTHARAVVAAIPPTVHPIDHVVHLVQTQFAQWGSFHAFEQLWETQVRLVLGTASPSHQRVFSSPDEGITFHSDFEGGNLWQVEKAVEPYYYYLWLEPDHGSDKRIWFRFAVSGAVEGRTLRFHLLNAATHAKLYRQHGMTPVWRDGCMQRNWTSVDQCSFRVASAVASGGQPPTYRSHHPHHHHGATAGTGVGGSGSSGTAADRADSPGAGRPEPTVFEDNGEVYFSVVPRSSSAVIQVAFCVPYTYADLLCHISHWHALVKSSVCSIRFEERVLCRTPEGRKLHLLIVTSPTDATKKKSSGKYDGVDGAAISRRRQLQLPLPSQASPGGGASDGATSAAAHTGMEADDTAPASGKDSKGSRAGASASIRGPYSNFGSGKKVVLISARVHPGEVTASHGCHGLISFVLSSDPRAVRLREHYLFFIVPMLNPDGVSRGHSRFDQFGNNLNRCYNAPDPTTQPTVFALRNVFQHLELTYQARFFLYIDFHSHASQSSGFMFGNHLPKTVHHWNMVFPKLVELHARDVFSFASCRFGKTQMSSKEGASRVLFGSTLIHSYTVELTYFTDGSPYADTFLAMNNRGSVIQDSSVSGPSYFESVTTTVVGPGTHSRYPAQSAGLTTSPTTATTPVGVVPLLPLPQRTQNTANTSPSVATSQPFPEMPAKHTNTDTAARSVPVSTTSRRSRTPAGVLHTAATKTSANGGIAAPTSQPNSVSHRRRSVGATTKPRSRSSASSTAGTAAAARRRARSEGAGSPQRTRRSLVSELIPGSRPGKDVPVPCPSAPKTTTAPTTTTTTASPPPTYLHSIAMPTILCQSAVIGQACLLALLDYGVVGGPRALSGELVSYGGMDHVLTQVKRAMTRKAVKKKRAAGTPNLL